MTDDGDRHELDPALNGYHLKTVRPDDEGWVAIAYHEGDDIKVAGSSAVEAAFNLGWHCAHEHAAQRGVSR